MAVWHFVTVCLLIDIWVVLPFGYLNNVLWTFAYRSLDGHMFSCFLGRSIVPINSPDLLGKEQKYGITHSCSLRELWRMLSTPSNLHPFPRHCRQKQCHLPERKSAIKTPAELPIQSFSHSCPKMGNHPSHCQTHHHCDISTFAGFRHLNIWFFLSGTWKLLLQFNKAFFFPFSFFLPNCLSVSHILQSFWQNV